MASAGDAQLQGSTPAASSNNGAPTPTAMAATTVVVMAVATTSAVRAACAPANAVATRPKDARPRIAASGAATLASRKSTRRQSRRASISPVARPRMTSADVWFPALPAVPVSLIKKPGTRALR